MATNCGLYCFLTEHHASRQQRTYLPQVTVKSSTTIRTTSYITKLRQTFSNPTDQKLKNASYQFPLYDGIAVTSFTCIVGDRKIVGRVEEEEKARKTFNSAVDRGESAGLLASAPAGIFCLSVGGIPARSNIIVDIEYGGELKHDAEIDGVRFTLPTAIAPRYGSYPGDVFSLHADEFNRRGIQIDVDFDISPLTVRSLKTPSATFESLLTTSTSAASDKDGLAATASLQLTDSEMIEDFVLLAEIDGMGLPQAIIESSEDCHTVMASFVPKFKLPNIKPEIIFVADQSGSMAGGKTKSLIGALTVFLKSLPAGALFNICAFGSRHTFVFPKSQPYSQETATRAIKFVNTFKAQYGGTELQNPIQEAFSKHSGHLPLEIILLTDGEIWGEEPLFDFINDQIATKKVDARIFCLGFGHDVSHTLVEGVARAGRGVSQFVTDKEELDQKVVRMLKAALSPHFEDVAVKLNYEDDDFEIVDGLEKSDKTTDASPSRGESKQHISTSLFDQSAELDTPIPDSDAEKLKFINTTIDPFNFSAPYNISLFPFSRTTIFSMTGPKAGTPSSISVTAKSSSGPLNLTIPIKPNKVKGLVVRKLAAKSYVHDLEQGRLPASIEAKFNSPPTRNELLQQAITLLGETHQIATKYTSYVAVEDKLSQGLPPEDTNKYTPWKEIPPGIMRGMGAGPKFMRSAMPPPPPAPAPAYAPMAMFGGKPPARSSLPGGGGPASVFGSASTQAVGSSLFGGQPTEGAPFGTPSAVSASGGGLFGSVSGAPALTGFASGNAMPLAAQAPIGGGWGAPAQTGFAAPPPPAQDYAANAFDDDLEDKVDACEMQLDDGDISGRSHGSTAGAQMMSRPNDTDEDDDAEIDNAVLQQAQARQASSSSNAVSDLFGVLTKSRKKKAVGMSTVPAADISRMSDGERLRAVISEQKFEGSWECTDNLLQVLQITAPGDALDPKATTVLVLEALKKKFARLEEIWELCAEKAQAWLDGQVSDQEMEKLAVRVRQILI
ncbi:Hypothetical protein D9617_17g047570 [Elsinoe fawcettii]|nr:Hypothetical protein D9617_17g047570 [Elsinoe fawcettii]